MYQAWRAAHVPVRGQWWLGRRPMVHQGFWRSWSAHGVGDRVLDFLGKLLADSKLAPADWHVYLTGGICWATAACVESPMNSIQHRAEVPSSFSNVCFQAMLSASC